jgi:UMF1 family MFS transporter
MPQNKSAPRTAIAGWVLFDWAAQPYFTLVTTFVFAPYFASAVASDPVQGQALWGYATACAGIVIAFCSPILGAIADASGRRKPWIAGFGAVLVVATSLLWFGKPHDPAGIPLVLAAFAIGTIAVEFATVFNNAMMPNLVPAEKIGSLSGTGWAIGYVGGLISLVITLGLLAADPTSGKTLLGLKPLFGLDAALHEGDRASGPLSALWFLIFVTPLFLFTPDHPGRMRVGPAIRTGLKTLANTLRGLPRRRDTALFLLANMIYADGLVALFAFGGIYAAGTFGWHTIEIGVFGILLTITGTIGAFVGGRLDDRFGPKFVILTSLALLIVGSTAILSITRDTIFFFVSVAPRAPDAGLYGSTAERVYVLVGLLIGIAAGPLQAASRTLLVRLAPPERVTQHFGLLALSGKVTSFFGPLLVALVTTLAASQRAGMTVLVVFFAVGATLLMQVKMPSRPPQSSAVIPAKAGIQ